MSKELGRFDPMDGGQFVEEVHEVNFEVAASIKWSVDNGRLKGDTAADILIFKPKTPKEQIASTGDY